MSSDAAAPSRDHIVPRALGGTNDMSNLKLAHKFCNSIRALGFSSTPHPKHIRFIERLRFERYRYNPNFSGPAEHGLECPDHLLPRGKQIATSAFFTLGPVGFDFRRSRGRYWHLRVSVGSRHLTGAGYVNE